MTEIFCEKIARKGDRFFLTNSGYDWRFSAVALQCQGFTKKCCGCEKIMSLFRLPSSFLTLLQPYQGTCFFS